jgi:co-chaperonin GroES (HSP10)
VKDAIERVDECECASSVFDALGNLLHEAPNPEHYIKVGDRVIFPMETGHEIVFNEDTDDAIVILNEDSVLAVVEAAESVA